VWSCAHVHDYSNVKLCVSSLRTLKVTRSMMIFARIAVNRKRYVNKYNVFIYVLIFFCSKKWVEWMCDSVYTRVCVSCFTM
jgi:hypothetical protein